MDRTRLSRRMAYLLRHDPASAGLHPSPSGAVPVRELAAALSVPAAEVREVVESDEKGRYVLEGATIRAAQGHSYRLARPVVVDVEVPEQLFHGTPWAQVDSIMRSGLQPMSRQYVHLSADRDTALVVARRRRGNPAVLSVDARAAAAAGHEVFMASNGVWQASEIPPEFLHVEH